MKMTNYAAEQHLMQMTDLRNETGNLPVMAGYRILQNIHSLETALKPYIDMRDETVRKHSGGKEELRSEEDPEAFRAAMAEIDSIGNLEVDVEINPLSIDLIRDRELPMKVLFALDFMLKEG